MFVGEAVDRTRPLAPESDQTAISKQAELMADARLAYARHGSKVADAQLLARQCVEDPEAGGVCQGREYRGGGLRPAIVGEPRADPLDCGTVDYGRLAGVRRSIHLII